MTPLRQLFRQVSAKLINRILDYVLGPIPQKAASASGFTAPAAPRETAASPAPAVNGGATKTKRSPMKAAPESRLEFVAQSAPTAGSAQGEHRNPRSDKRTSRPAAPNATAQLPLAGGKSTLRPLDHNIEHEGTVWIPRVLWALAWADLNESEGAGKTASELTKILEEQAGLAVRPNNFARAFRDLKTDSRARGLWTVVDKRYTITESGKALLHEIVG